MVFCVPPCKSKSPRRHNAWRNIRRHSYNPSGIKSFVLPLGEPADQTRPPLNGMRRKFTCFICHLWDIPCPHRCKTVFAGTLSEIAFFLSVSPKCAKLRCWLMSHSTKARVRLPIKISSSLERTTFPEKKANIAESERSISSANTSRECSAVTRKANKINFLENYMFDIKSA